MTTGVEGEFPLEQGEDMEEEQLLTEKINLPTANRTARNTKQYQQQPFFSQPTGADHPVFANHHNTLERSLIHPQCKSF
jgi:hypothetical protein